MLSWAPPMVFHGPPNAQLGPPKVSLGPNNLGPFSPSNLWQSRTVYLLIQNVFFAHFTRGNTKIRAPSARCVQCMNLYFYIRTVSVIWPRQTTNEERLGGCMHPIIFILTEEIHFFRFIHAAFSRTPIFPTHFPFYIFLLKIFQKGCLPAARKSQMSYFVHYFG